MRAVLEKAALTAPKDPQPQFELAMFDRMTGDAAAASSRLLGITTNHPKYERAAYHLGMIALQNGAAKEAAQWLSRAAAALPDDPQVLTNASVALLRAGNPSEAKRLAESALKRDDRFPDAYLVLARIEDQERRYESALAHLRRYEVLAPNPSPGFYLMGRIYHVRADGKNAEESLRKAIEADPENPEVHALLGRVYLEHFGVMRMDDAIRTLSQAVKLNPQHPTANYHLGQALANVGRNEEAVAALQAALKTSPEPGPVHYELYQTLLQLGRKDEAAIHLSKHREFQTYTSTFNRLSTEIDRNPRDPKYRFKLVDFCLKERQPKAAELVLQEAVREVPSAAASFYRKLAHVYEQMGREDLATRARDAAYLKERGRGG